MLPSPDAIAEFKVQSNLQPAEFGRGLGGTINISLRSGTNEFHGVAFEFMRNDKLDANNFFNAGRARPPSSRTNSEEPWAGRFTSRSSMTGVIGRSSLPTIKARAFAKV